MGLAAFNKMRREQALKQADKQKPKAKPKAKVSKVSAK
jgi:hypothetical protein